MSETIVLSGRSKPQSKVIKTEFYGWELCLSHVTIDDHISYEQQSSRHVLHAALNGWRQSKSMRSSADKENVRGALSFTSVEVTKKGRSGKAEILGLEIGLDHSFLEDANERRIPVNLISADEFNDAKISAVADAMAASAQGQYDRLASDTFALLLARRLGQRFASIAKRRDDGWLHPCALARVIAKLQDEPSMLTSLKELADESGLGISAFVRGFRGATGVTPAVFAHRLRILNAERLLLDRSLTISNVATESGFSSASHLILAFRKYRGVTPTQWRKAVLS